MRRNLLLLLPLSYASAEWLRITSPHFELLSDAGEKRGRAVLDRLETVRHVFLESIGGKAPALPVRVFQFSSERDFRRYAPNPTVRGFHQGAADRDYIAILGSGDEALRAVRHEYMHLLLSHGSAALPLWLEEGTAEVYSTVELREAGAVFGSPVEGHVRALRANEWLSADAFFNLGKGARVLDRENYVGIFYAQSWALVHMLNFSPHRRKSLPRFAELIDQGTPALLAFEPAFGEPPARALVELRNYVGSMRFATALVPMPPRPAQEDAVAVRLDEATVRLAQVELLLTLRQGEQGAKLLDGYDGPPSPELETARGLAALARRDNAAAKARFLEAIRLGDRTAVPAFEYAMMLRDENAPVEQVRRFLAEAVGRNPNLAEAQFILGVMAQKENRHSEAVEFFEQALRVLPRQSYFWHARAMSHLALKQPELARRAALRAAASAVSASELEMAQAAVKLAGATKTADAPAPPKPAVVVPDSWKPRQGAASVEGTLEQIDCFGPSARFQIRPGPSAAPVRLWVDKPGEILLKDASSLTFTFACGPQQPRKVAVEYDPQADLPQSTAGRITAIRFY